MHSYGTDRARRYLARTTVSGDIDEVVEAALTERAEAAMPRGVDATELVRKVARGATLNRAEEFALEAVIIPELRPAIDIVDGTYDVRHAAWTDLNDACVRKVLEPAFASVGRVELPGHPTLPHGGTAFVVGKDLLMTNRHVADAFATGLGTTGLRFVPDAGAAVDFGRERGDTMFAPEAATGLVMVHPWWDMALFRIEGLSAGRRPLALSATGFEESIGRRIAVVGYPAFEPRNPYDVQRAVFGNVYGVKRLQPGVMRPRGRIDSYGNIVAAARHDASTLGRNSGSCVIDIATGEVLALHFGGHYLEDNFAVAASDLARDGRVTDAGVTFSGGAPRGPTDWDGRWHQIEAAAVEERMAASPTEVTPTRSRTDARATARLAVPLDTAGISEHRKDASALHASGGEALHDPGDAAHRGYDADFLGVPAPMPVQRAPESFVPALDGSRLLHYNRLSLVMTRGVRIPALSAANVDAQVSAGHGPQDHARDGLALRSSVGWFTDRRAGATARLPHVVFDAARSAFNGLHPVHRDDETPGTADEEHRRSHGGGARPARGLTQVCFDPSPNGSDVLGEFETRILAQADDARLCVFAGPVQHDPDPLMAGRGREDGLSLCTQRLTWSIVAARAGGALRCFAFIEARDLTDVAFAFGASRRPVRCMVPISEIEALSGFDFHAAFHSGDQYGTETSATIADAVGMAASGTVGGGLDAVSTVADPPDARRAEPAPSDDRAGRAASRSDRPATDAGAARRSCQTNANRPPSSPGRSNATVHKRRAAR